MVTLPIAFPPHGTTMVLRGMPMTPVITLMAPRPELEDGGTTIEDRF